MPYVFSMTSRMVAIAATCAILLCVLLFLMGMEIGARLARPPGSAAPVPAVASDGAAPSHPAAQPSGEAPAQSAAVSEMAAVSASPSTP